ncbi:mycothiol-dependent nitroreductase Rv2466c family protein, partial [Clavibacter michiganensis]
MLGLDRGAAVEAEHGAEHVKPLYDALRARVHPPDQKDAHVVIPEVLAELRLPAEPAGASPTDPHAGPHAATHFAG